MSFVITVLGASGGLGTSTFACALAHAAAATGTKVALVEGDTGRAGLDVTAVVEHLSGHRWPDLAAVEGRVDGTRLWQALPGDDGVRVLAGGGRGAPPAAREAVVQGLVEGVDLVVVDGGQPARGGGTPGWWAPDGARVTLLLVGLTPRRIHDARDVVTTDVDGVVTRGPRRRDDLAESAARHVGLPWWGHLADDPRLPADESRGRPPGTRGDALGRVAAAALSRAGWPGARQAS
ncbi:hypothetical protein [Janibacter sp. G1551]|uniref:hypothetical protein n=1 Tax=Janibacter sp. G1551 TaxID=3420440 RepID=UPI003D02C8E8